jgi:hypothetical protein
MDRGLVSPEWAPLVTLLYNVLERISTDLPKLAPVNLSVSTGSSTDVVVLAGLGAGVELVEAQIYQLGGPLADAVATGLPVAADDLWSDPRWPRLTRQAITAMQPHLHATWARIHGMAVMPAGHDEHSMVVVSCCLPGPADERVIEVLARYRQLLESAIAVTRATSIDGPEQVLRMLQSRAIIEQAKGAIVGRIACSPEHAWHCLREASQVCNVKLRDLAIALIELLSHATAEHPVGLPRPTVAPAAHDAAATLWKSLA